jgi:hypothetical protein
VDWNTSLQSSNELAYPVPYRKFVLLLLHDTASYGANLVLRLRSQDVPTVSRSQSIPYSVSNHMVHSSGSSSSPIT